MFSCSEIYMNESNDRPQTSRPYTMSGRIRRARHACEEAPGNVRRETTLEGSSSPPTVARPVGETICEGKEIFGVSWVRS